jgi:hypothetical protein
MDDENTWPAFAELPEWVQQRINGSVTFQQGGIQLDKDGRVQHYGPPPAEGDSLPYNVSDINDDDLPF